MTKYAGGKKKIASYIVDKILEIEAQFIDKEILDYELDYIEPFSGMASIALELAKEIDKGAAKRKIVISDSNENITKFWKGLKSGEKPKKFISEKMYNDLKYSKVSFQKSYVGFEWSFGGGWFAGYIGRYHTLSETKKLGLSNYNKIMKLKPLTKYITIKSTRSFSDYEPHNQLIYLDPPYLNTKRTTNNDYLKDFDTYEFWKTATKWSKDNLVFISEVKENIPRKYKDKYSIMWRRKTHRSVDKVKDQFKTECLFLHKSWAKYYDEDYEYEN